MAGLLHDVGKIGVSDELISRPGPLEPHEWEEMRQHPEIAYRMLSGADLGDVRVSCASITSDLTERATQPGSPASKSRSRAASSRSPTRWTA